MAKKVYSKKERKPIHAGVILKHGFIDQYGLKIETVANLLGIARGHLSRIINGHSPVTAEIALKLELLTQTPAHQWLTMQSKYDAYMIEQDETFTQYKEALKRWISSSLSLLPNQKQNDKNSYELALRAGELAKHINKRKVTA